MPQAGEESRSGAVAGRRSGPVRPASSGQIRPSRPRRAATPQRTETWRGIEPTCHDRAAAAGDNPDAFAGLVPPRARTTVPCDARNFLGSSHASHLLKSGAKPSAASASPLSQNHIDAAPQTIANGAWLQRVMVRRRCKKCVCRQKMRIWITAVSPNGQTSAIQARAGGQRP